MGMNEAESLAFAQAFNKEVLKGQLNPNGDTVRELAARVKVVMDAQWQAVFERSSEITVGMMAGQVV